jgi:hypothetical protein
MGVPFAYLEDTNVNYFYTITWSKIITMAKILVCSLMELCAPYVAEIYILSIRLRCWMLPQ